MTNVILQRSNEIWEYTKTKHKNKCYAGFYEIRKLEKKMQDGNLCYSTKFEDGGLTIIFKHENGKHLGKARENCYSEGAALDLLEVYGLHKDGNQLHGYISADEAFSMFLNSLHSYTLTLKTVA